MSQELMGLFPKYLDKERSPCFHILLFQTHLIHQANRISILQANGIFILQADGISIPQANGVVVLQDIFTRPSLGIWVPSANGIMICYKPPSPHPKSLTHATKIHKIQPAAENN